MSDAKLPQNPSMEEIIASIGRILAEDGGPRALEAAPPAGDEDVLELTEALDADGRVRRIEPRLAAPELPAPDAGRLLSKASAQAAAAAFARLDAPPQSDSAGSPAGSGAPSLDDIVRDALRPLLQRWLDEHLPALVERVVREEIARVAQDAGR
jgi:uncharacterized protein